MPTYIINSLYPRTLDDGRAVWFKCICLRGQFQNLTIHTSTNTRAK